MPRKSSSRVIIRSPAPADCAAFLHALRRSRALHRPWVAPKQTTPDMFHQFLERHASDANHAFLVVRRSTGDLVGAINLNNVIRGTFQSASVGYYAFVPHQGQGLMREGLRLALRHAFLNLKLHRIEANIQPGNRPSIALARRCGFSKEGFSRRFLKISSRWRDHERWVIFAEDFR